jgi:hypothetical protein
MYLITMSLRIWSCLVIILGKVLELVATAFIVYYHTIYSSRFTLSVLPSQEPLFHALFQPRL